MTKIPFSNFFIDLFKIYFKEFYEFDNDLNALHTLLNTDKITVEDKMYHSKIQKIGVNDRNSIFIKNYHKFIDRNEMFFKEYKNFIQENIKVLFPNEEKLVVQKTPNIRISFPNSTAIGANENDPENVIGLHCDSDFGHHFEEMNFIIPITEMFETNSIYYEPQEKSNVDYHEYFNLCLKTDEIFMVKFNQLKHYNRINQTGQTRISLDLRVIPYSKYIENLDFFRNTKFDIDTNNYYCVI